MNSPANHTTGIAAGEAYAEQEQSAAEEASKYQSALPSDVEIRIAQEMIAASRTLQSTQSPEMLEKFVISRTKNYMQKSLMHDVLDIGSAVAPDALGKFIPQSDVAIIDSFTKTFADEITQSAAQNLNEIAAAAGNAAMGQITGERGALDNLEHKTGRLSARAKASLFKALIESGIASGNASNLHFLTQMETTYSVDENGVGAFSILGVQPLFETDNKQHTVLAQASYLKKDDRDTANIGFMYRYMPPSEKHLWGVNAFYDHQWPYHHERMSIGVEYKNALMGLSANHYTSLSGWKARNNLYDERALSGYDLELSGIVPDVPQLELFVKGYKWSQKRTNVTNPEGKDI